MKVTIKINLMLVLWLSTCSLFGQVVQEKTERAKRRTEQKVDQKVDQKIDKAIDGAFDKVSSVFKRKKRKKSKDKSSSTSSNPERSTPNESETESDATPSFTMGKADDSQMASSYRFDKAVTIHTETIKKSGKVKDKTDFDWLLSDKGDIFGMRMADPKQGQSVVIFDNQNNSLITLLENEKRAMVLPIQNSLEENDDDPDVSDDVTIVKTGRTKTILGYACSEYTIDSEDLTGNIWVTKELHAFDVSKMPNRLKKQQKGTWVKNADINGMMLESHLTEKNKKGYTIHTKATKISHSGRNFTMSNYEVMSLGGFGF
ncbi:MAG TPA: DUF4412 domain-containing protein [Saprospiraceae bacterium]|nr:DUF4412 domain-containing protein [Saprospiraceae bacterium]